MTSTAVLALLVAQRDECSTLRPYSIRRIRLRAMSKHRATDRVSAELGI